MKSVPCVFLSLLSLFVISPRLSVAADRVVVLPINDSVAVYPHETPRLLERPLFKASLEDRLLVIESGKDRYLVKNREGREGWIEKTLCAQAPRGTSFGFDSLIIQGQYDDLKSFVWVGGDSPQDDGRLFIGRSFKSELRSNVDKDEMEKRMGQ